MNDNVCPTTVQPIIFNKSLPLRLATIFQQLLRQQRLVLSLISGFAKVAFVDSDFKCTITEIEINKDLPLCQVFISRGAAYSGALFMFWSLMCVKSYYLILFPKKPLMAVTDL